jgi:hypothetical protein
LLPGFSSPGFSFGSSCWHQRAIQRREHDFRLAVEHVTLQQLHFQIRSAEHGFALA